MTLALEGIRILDLTRVLAGPYATMILADLGAEVIKLEMPGHGDDARAFPPHVAGESAYFMSLNRNKRSMTLNLKQEAGKQLFRDLIKKVDVVVENFRPGTMKRLGLDYDSLKTINPGLIYAAASGFGQTGPYRQRAAYDAIVQAMGGVMSITGPAGGPTTRIGTSMGDITAGMFTAIGILAALRYRDQTGQGQMVDVSMLDSQVAILENAIARYAVTGTIPEPIGNRHPSIVPFESFATADSQIMIAAGNDVLWTKLCEALGIEDLVDNPLYESNELRIDNYVKLRPLLAAPILTKTTKEWQTILDNAGVPNGPINNVAQVMQDPQVQAREMIIPVNHPSAGILNMPGIPIKLSETPGSIRQPAPLLGQHTDEILANIFGYSPEEIGALKANDIF
ncbi:MAG: CoA transferase [Anaerolineales bacterium]|nr:CoA transferase [Anaerolineales bacterium]